MASQKPHGFWLRCSASNGSSAARNNKPVWPSNVCGLRFARCASADGRPAFTNNRTRPPRSGSRHFRSLLPDAVQVAVRADEQLAADQGRAGVEGAVVAELVVG